MSVDPITIEVLRNRLDAIANNMETTLVRSAYSTVIKEAADCSVALFDCHGNTVAQGVAIPVHLGSLPPAVKCLIERFPPDTLEEGDVLVMNDPYAGGQHYPDILVMVPIVHDGETLALAVALAHHQDVGGRAPGSTPTDARTIYDEGLCIPPLKLMRDGKMDPAIEAFIRHNVRFPDLTLGDIKAEIAAGRAAAKEFLALVRLYGRDVVTGAMRDLLDRAEIQTRAHIERIPDGTYHFTDWLDNDGLDLEARVRISVAVTVKGSDLQFDFTGTSSQVEGPINAVPPVTMSAVRYVVRVITDPEIPNNEGVFRMVSIKLPEASLLNPRRPAAVNCRSVTLRRVVDTLMGAFAQALPGKIPAASNGHPLWASFGATDRATGRSYIVSELGTGGQGARPGKDGVDCVQTDTSNSQNMPVEVVEATSPLRINYFGIRRDSGGPGRFRGGCGFEKEYECLIDHMQVSHRGERHFSQPWGLQGGLPGSSSRSIIVRADGSEHVIPSKQDFELNKGDRLILLTSGGGGMGDPIDRPLAAVFDDVLDNKVSANVAAEVYGLILKADGSPDLAGSEQRRGTIRDGRHTRSSSADNGISTHR